MSQKSKNKIIIKLFSHSFTSRDSGGDLFKTTEMKRYRINYEALQGGNTPMLEEVFGEREAEVLLKDLANEMVKRVDDFKGWQTVTIKLGEEVRAEVCAEFTEASLFQIDYITLLINALSDVVYYDYTISDELCSYTEDEVNETYLFTKNKEWI